MKSQSRLAALLTAASLVVLAPAAALAADAALEAKFDGMIDPAEMGGWLKTMAAEPNHVGAPHNKANADMTLAQFKSWGWDAKIETFMVLYPTPKEVALELTSGRGAPFKATLAEAPVPGDETSTRIKDELPAYVAFQGDGDVTAPLVYVNYGMPADYDALERLGVSVKGKIAIARYGGGWRGLKPKLAQEHGAVGAIIYSDPRDDGYATDDVYPKGAARPPQGFQRGSVADMTLFPGDPSTPGYGSTKDAKRVAREDSPSILKIPTLPISYGDAQVLLTSLDGPVAPASFRGSLPITYHVGGGDGGQVHIRVVSDWSLKPAYNVIATLKGREKPDEWVMRGNHRDGWVFGAADPLTGQVAEMNEAKALGALYRQGWRPARTIVYASWDAEEPSLLGSTEWVETHAEELKRKALLYINTDNNGRGFLYSEGSQDLQHFVDQAAGDVLDPQTGVPVPQRSRAQILASSYTDPKSVRPDLVDAAKSGGELPMAAVGAGSDYSPFVQHLGIASVNLGFGGEDFSGGSYHSAYDTFYHVMHFDDPGLAYGAALSKVVGRLVLRASAAPRIPAHYSDFANSVSRYLGEVIKLADDQREKDRALADLRREGDFKLASAPYDPLVAPADKGITPLIDMLPLQNAVDHLKRAASDADSMLAREDKLPPGTQARINAALADIDQLLIDPQGLPGRPWYKNLIYAPGTLTGYGAKTLPGVREAIEQRRFDDARTYVQRTAAVIENYANRLDQAVAMAGGS
jgi:N-acetylated-alpha-linked acidic dipeptidase